jgi:hypothetical protein
MKAGNKDRKDRLAAALRENLKRRKALERTRAQAGSAAVDDPCPEKGDDPPLEGGSKNATAFAEATAVECGQ